MSTRSRRNLARKVARRLKLREGDTLGILEAIAAEGYDVTLRESFLETGGVLTIRPDWNDEARPERVFRDDEVPMHGWVRRLAVEAAAYVFEIE